MDRIVRVFLYLALGVAGITLSGSNAVADIALPPFPPGPPVGPPVGPTPTPSASPEPASIVTGLVGAGAASLVAWGIRRRRRKATI